MVALAGVLVSASCQIPTSTVSPVQPGSGVAGSSAQPAAATFTEIYQMLFPRITNAHCDMCHGLPPFDLSNGNFSTGTDRASTYASLVGKSSSSSLCKGKLFVDPKHPESSLLLQKLLPNPPCGLRMPNGGANLSDAQVEMVRSWIAAGAADD
jgi:hypothetical protein